MLKKIKNFLKRIYIKKEPVPYPIFQGELLKDKTALITGGGSGIGLEIARSFIKNGANVIIVGRNEKKLEAACKSLRDEGTKGTINYYKMDISDSFKIKAAWDIITNNNQKIEILVNNASINCNDDFLKQDIKEFNDVLKTNLSGTYYLTQLFSNYLIKSKIHGNILNILSSSSNRPAINAYGISKWGLNGFTKGVAKKLIKYNIVVNGIAPGPTATSMVINDKKQGINNPKSLTGRYIMPEEIANLAVYLTSDLGRMIVGETIYITGGAGTLTFDDIDY